MFIQENAFESVVCKMVSILPQPQYVKLTDDAYVRQWTGS